MQGIVRCNCLRADSTQVTMPWGCVMVGIYGDWTRAIELATQMLGGADAVQTECVECRAPRPPVSFKAKIFGLLSAAFQSLRA